MFSRFIQAPNPPPLTSSLLDMFCSALGHMACCLCAQEEALADTRPFDPYYSPLQTMDFNYQTAHSATASSSACLPSETAEKVSHQLQCGSLFVSLWSRLPITPKENLMAVILISPSCLKGDTATAVCKGTLAGYIIQKRAFQGEGKCPLGYKRWTAGWE